MRQFFDTLNHASPALTLLILVGGFVWTVATRNAQFEELRGDLADLKSAVKAVESNVDGVQGEVRSVRETQAHMLSCTIDLDKMTRQAEIFTGRTQGITDPPREMTFLTFSAPISEPASCEQARQRTAPTQGN